MAVNGCLRKGAENDWGRLRKVSEVLEMFSLFIVVMVVTWGSQLAVNSSDYTLEMGACYSI